MKNRKLFLIILWTMIVVWKASCNAVAVSPDELEGAQAYNGHTYKVFNIQKNWDEAKIYCENLGGHLVTVTSSVEEDFVDKLPNLKKRYNYWLGATDEVNEGSWMWVTGEAFSYTNWAEGMPDNYQSGTGMPENYLQACYDWGMKWNDSSSVQDSSASAGFICEWDYEFTTREAVEKDIKTIGDNDLPYSEYELLQAKIQKTTKSSLKLTWKRISDADGYIIYGNKCGRKNKYKYLCTLEDKSRTSYTAGKLKRGTYYKYFVVAYKNVAGNKVIITTSKTIHSTTDGGKNGNAKSVKLTQIGNSKKKLNKYTMSVNKTAKIKGKSIKKNRKINNHRGLAFESSNPSIVEVNSYGVMTAKTAGKCKVYVYAQNGVSQVINITVR